MRDLTTGPVDSHLFRMAVPIAAGMLFQTLYYIVDLYFVAHIGEAAIAGVGASGNIVFLVMALTMMISAGTLALLSQAVGRKDQIEANLVFNQSLAISVAFSVATLIFGRTLSSLYMNAVGADQATIQAGITYLTWFLPGLAIQFVMTAMVAALRATGVVRPTLIVQAVSLSLNIVLAPVLIAGWFTGHALGVAGAGLASSLSLAVGFGLLLLYFLRLKFDVKLFFAQWLPSVRIWWRLFMIGLPAGGEFAFLFVYTAIIFALIRHFGDAAQAGFGVGSRLMQAIFLPGMAVAFAAAPIADKTTARATARASAPLCARRSSSAARSCFC